MSDELMESLEGRSLSRRDILLAGGAVAAGATFLRTPAAAFGALAGETVTQAKIGVVTHGDTGSFWSVFKKGVDQAAKDLGSSAVKVTQVYANNDVSKQVAGVNAAIAAKVHVIVTSVPDASALKDPLSRAASRGIVVITANSGLGDFDNLKTYMTHVGQTEDIAGQGAGLQFNTAGAKNLVVVIHEASNSGLTQRAAGAKKTFKGSTKSLVIPNATSDLPGMQAKLRAYFKANSKTDALLGLNPDVTAAALAAVPKGTKVGTFDLSGQVINAINDGDMLFAIDQQQYLQGYLGVLIVTQYAQYGLLPGGGNPILTGPGFVTQENAAQVIELSAEGIR